VAAGTATVVAVVVVVGAVVVIGVDVVPSVDVDPAPAPTEFTALRRTEYVVEALRSSITMGDVMESADLHVAAPLSAYS
jgi:NADH:ubiquinone oxidoreductase subunit 6 (subunit J)